MNIIVTILFVLMISCTTVDIDKQVLDAGYGADNGTARAALAVMVEPEIIETERPVYVPEQEAAQTPQPPSGDRAVRQSNQSGIQKPRDYSHAAMIYDYHADWVYEVYTQPLRACDIQLAPGETAVEAPFISDSERWMLGAGVSYERGTPVQHIYVKPAEISLEASLIINTNQRVYHIILRSYRDVHMPIVKWRYPVTGMPNNFIQPVTAEGAASGGQPGIDPRYLSFNYRITYGLLGKPAWLPELAFDDGKKTYITFPETVLQRQSPAVFENRRDVVNYRVAGNVIIIDKLIETISVKIEKKHITITKKRG